MTRQLKTTSETGNLFASLEQTEHLEDKALTTHPIDQVAREQALDTTRSWVIEAPAGSGKTGLLIQRYLKLLAHADVEAPEQVLAITFTQKAAAEIRDRVIEQLTKATRASEYPEHGFTTTARELASDVLSRDQQLGWSLLEHPERLNLRTIDSLCAEIARSTPVFSGRGDFSPIEDAKPLYRAAAEQTLLQLGGTDPRLNNALSLLLLHRDGDLLRCRELLAQMLALRDQWGRLIPLNKRELEDSYLDAEVLPHLEKTLKEEIEAELLSLYRKFPKRSLERLCSLLEEMSHASGYKGAPSPIAVCAGNSGPVEPTADDLERWRAISHTLLTEKNWRSSLKRNHLEFEISSDQATELEDILSSLRGNEALRTQLRAASKLPSARYPADQWRIAKALFVVLHRALAELQIVFAERGECDFTEISLVARAALLGGASLVGASEKELKHLLVDEMQDTSTSQYELLQLLTQGWDGRSQTVFFVGDPKQSIYLFRQARVERFLRMTGELRLGDLTLGLLQLRSNFRSQLGLIDSFNSTFSSIFPLREGHLSHGEVVYTAADPVRESSPSVTHPMTWHARVIRGDRSDSTLESSRIDEHEAIEIRRIIEYWRAKPLPEGREEPWKIAVLVRNRRHLTRIVLALKRNDGDGPVPFQAVNIDSLTERPEVLDLFALTRALLHPADRIAWLSVLRAPWCGLTLADMHVLCGQDDAGWDTSTVTELIHLRGELLSESGQSLIQRVEPLLIASGKKILRVPLPQLVERTWKSLGGDTYLSADELENTDRYFELLSEMENEGGGVDLKTLHQRLSGLYATPSASEDAVDLMTIHGAKGLEWDVVLVPGLAKRIQTEGHRLLTWEELSNGEGGEMLLAPIVGKGGASERLNEWLRGLQTQRQTDEAKRLFYVACTRAKEELHLFAALGRNMDGSLRPRPGTLLAAAWPSAEKQFVDDAIPSRPVIAPIVMIRESTENLVIPAIAAESANTVSASICKRIPAKHRATVLQTMDSEPQRTPPTNRAKFSRSEGSFEARAFGKVVHTMLEYIAGRVVRGADVHLLSDEIPNWKIRIVALLRSAGLSMSDSRRLSIRVQEALTLTLKDPHGQWLLHAHDDAMSEHSLMHWDKDRSSFRLDRSFRAGNAPLSEGSDYLWIVDFKATQYFGTETGTFLELERQKYASQLAAYANAVEPSTPADRIRLGLYYPMLSRLIWWKHEA